MACTKRSTYAQPYVPRRRQARGICNESHRVRGYSPAQWTGRACEVDPKARFLRARPSLHLCVRPLGPPCPHIWARSRHRGFERPTDDTARNFPHNRSRKYRRPRRVLAVVAQALVGEARSRRFPRGFSCPVDCMVRLASCGQSICSRTASTTIRASSTGTALPSCRIVSVQEP